MPARCETNVLRWFLRPGFVGFARQFLNFPCADVAIFKFDVDGQQGNDLFNLDVIDNAESAALASPSGAIGQAHLINGVTDPRYKLAGALIIPEGLDKRRKSI